MRTGYLVGLLVSFYFIFIEGNCSCLRKQKHCKYKKMQIRYQIRHTQHPCQYERLSIAKKKKKIKKKTPGLIGSLFMAKKK